MREILRLYREHGPYSLVLTDWKHEGPDGLEPIGLMTATSLASFPELRIKEFAFLLQKPFDLEELMGVIREAASNVG